MEKITSSKLDPNFKYEIARRSGAENIRKCFSCGTCTAGCPVFQVEADYNPRKLIRMILLGMRKEVLSSKLIWLCAKCYACTANCPQDVSFADIATVLRDMAIEEGYATRELIEKIEALSVAAHQFRKDSINILTGAGDTSKEQIQQNISSTLEGL
jgi:heterodisulfide reductase subunit C